VVEQVAIISHRGLSGDEPENSLAAFRASVARGIEAIEFDVRQTLDRVLVICHDPAAAGLSIADATYAQLSARAGGLCTLAEALAAIPPQCLLDVEIKEHGFEASVLAELAAARDRSDYVITSFEDRIVAAVKKLDPAVRAGLLLGADDVSLRTRLSELFPVARLRACTADFVAPNWQLLRFGFLGRMERAGFAVYVWTVNDARAMRRLIGMPQRVAALITDDPLQAMRLREPAG
jgi:glycerophosphoryl diester phosphodiesterase